MNTSKINEKNVFDWSDFAEEVGVVFDKTEEKKKKT